MSCENRTVTTSSADDLDLARIQFPLAAQVTGRVTAIPRPGAIGLFVDLAGPPQGFVDVLQLPEDADNWPPVGTVTAFEIRQHTHGQVRLWPLDPQFQTSQPHKLHPSEAEWQLLKARYPVDARINAKVSNTYVLNREYVVDFPGGHAVLAWSGAAPMIGNVGTYQVSAHWDSARRLLLEPDTH